MASLKKKALMRKSTVIVTSLILAACGGSTTGTLQPAANASAEDPQPPAPVEPAPLTPAEARSAALADYAVAWDAGEVERAASHYADDAVIRLAGLPDIKGRDAIAGVIAANTGASSDDGTPFTRLFTHGNVIVGEWIWAGTHTGDLNGLPPTQKRFGLQGVSIYFFDEAAKLEAAHVYFDAGTLMTQLGVSKQPARAALALPTEPALSVVSANTETEARNTALAHTLMGAFERKREADFLASVTDATEWNDMRHPGSSKGIKDAKARFKMLTNAFPDAKVSISNTWATGDYVIVEGTFSGTHRGALGPIKAT
jgi:predicted ester cyclase